MTKTNETIDERLQSQWAKQEFENRIKGFFTLEEVSHCLATQESFDENGRKALLKKLVVAAKLEKLQVFDPVDYLPLVNPTRVRAFHELVSKSAVNKWLDSECSPYLWRSDIPVDVENLTETEAKKWLSFLKPWTLEEATLIFAGHSPQSRHFFKDDDASGFWLAFNFWHRFKNFRKDLIPKSQHDWLKLAHRENWPLPKALLSAMSPDTKSPQLKPKKESAIERQSRRHQACIDTGLKLPTSDYGRLPNGIRRLAEIEGVSRQQFSKDVKAHINRLFPRK